MSPGRARARLLSPVLWAFFCALLIRTLLPAGVMVSADAATGPTVVLCGGSGVYEAALDPDGRLRPIDRHKPATEHGHTCPFAGGHIFLTPSEVEPAGATPLAWTRAEPAPARAHQGALRLRAPPPPSQAPPVLSA